jgi:amino acid permease
MGSACKIFSLFFYLCLSLVIFKILFVIAIVIVLCSHGPEEENRIREEFLKHEFRFVRIQTPSAMGGAGL